MTMHGDRNPNTGTVTRHHLFDELTVGTGGIEWDLSTNYCLWRAKGAGQIDVAT